MRRVDSGKLLRAVLGAKDRIVKQRHETACTYMDLYERLGRLVSLYLHVPDKAVEELMDLCDTEFELTGDCKATGLVADLLDPDGKAFERYRAKMKRAVEAADA